ncbi:MAG: Ig-like domain-containing protein [Gammaproteobacteria bacterium]|nr:Ig-like domain-containing protein [Gammaproteobacteria bacterium]MDH3806545.1 Ig-like domain-containing protein [Gammaproteobacteria bacterium]
MASSLVACNIGSYDDAVDRYNSNLPPPPPPPPPAGFGPNFSEIQASVFTPSCTGCHSGAAPSAGLNLDAANSYTMLVGIASTQDAGTQRVDPGNPNASYLIQKLEGPGAAGGQMPPTGPLPQADIDVIRQWIMDGAIDDRVQASNPIRVISLSPMPGANLNAAPVQIVAGFDRDLDASTVNATTFILENSSGVPVAAAVPPAIGGTLRSAIFDLTGVALADDTYTVRLLGTGASVIMDLDANALDGELIANLPSGDGTAGGDLVAQFTITTPVVIGPTLDQIQAVVFSPTCATAGCHSAGTMAGGLNLSDADTSLAQLVGVPSSNPAQAGEIRVIAFDPDNSYLIKKLENAAGISGQQMPFGGTPLSATDVGHIRQWITDGALR